jgi:hypothetical protein
VSYDIVGKARGDQQIPPIGLCQSNRVLKFAQISIAQFERGKSDTFHCCFVFVPTTRKVVSALFLQHGACLFPAIRRKEKEDSPFGFGAQPRPADSIPFLKDPWLAG